MPRAGQVKPPAGERLPDRIAIGLLTVTFPPELVDRVVAETGRVQQRSRLLPARVVVYYVLAMCLFFGQGYEEVARLLTEGHAPVPGKYAALVIVSFAATLVLYETLVRRFRINPAAVRHEAPQQVPCCRQADR